MAFKINNSDSITNDRGLVSSQISLFPHSTIEVSDPSSSPLTPAWGTSQGFCLGGILPTGPNTIYDDIDRFPFASDTSATDVGNLLFTSRSGGGAQSTTHGYYIGGDAYTAFVVTAAIQKFPLTAPTVTASTVNNLMIPRFRVGGVSSGVASYALAGHGTAFSPGVSHTAVEKFPFAADTYISYVGEMSSNLAGGFGTVSSAEAGYATGGVVATPYSPVSPAPPAGVDGVNTIQKFKFATDGNLNDIGDLTQARGLTTSASSPVAGYTMGGSQTPAVRYNTIDKFPYVNESRATDVGDLTSASVAAGAGAASTASGYHMGGISATAPGAPPTTTIATIDKFSFASDGNATNIGSLSRVKATCAGVVD